MITVLWWMRVIITQFMITMMHIHFFTIWQNYVLLPCPTLNRIDNMMIFVLLFFWFSDLSVYNIWTITIRLDCMQFLHSSRTSCILTLFYTKSIDFFFICKMLKILINQKNSNKKGVLPLFFIQQKWIILRTLCIFP